MVFDVTDPQKTPWLSEIDRSVLLLYSLAVTNKPQIEWVTGWTEHKINGLLKRMQHEGLLRRWVVGQRKPHLYTLTEKGVKRAKELRREYADDPKVVGAQAVHYLSTNEVLVGLIKRGFREGFKWYGPRETGLWFYHEAEAREGNPKIRPDAILQAEDGRAMAIEVDLGTIPAPRMRARMHKYLDLAQDLPNVPDYMFVTTATSRRNELARCLNKALEERGVFAPAQRDWTVSFHLLSDAADYLAGWLLEPVNA